MTEKTRGIIYKYTNKINGKVYIGQTIDEKQRIRSHRNSKVEDHFHRAIRKYGWDNFEYEVIFETISSDPDRLKFLLNTMEKYFIRKYNSYGKGGYNCTDGGGGILGYLHSEETREKISIANWGKKRTEETKRKISEARKGRKHTEEAKKKLSEINRGKRLSEDAKRKLSEAKKNMSEETKRKIGEAKKKPINQYTKDGVFVCSYKSATDAAKGNNWSVQNIGECARGKNKTAYGYIWRYNTPN